MAGLRVIVTGSDPEIPLGGIAVAVAGYLRALDAAGLAHDFVATYRAGSFNGKSVLWLRGMVRMVRLAVRARRNAETPVVYSHAGSGISLLREGILLMLARLSGARTVVHLHAPTIDGYLRSAWQRPLFRLSLAGAHAVFVLTPWWQQRLSGVGKPLHVVPNPLPDAVESAARGPERTTARARGESINVLTMSRIVPGKGVRTAVRAMALLPESVSLTIAGEGTLVTELRALIETLRLQHRVELVGWVDGARKTALLEDADVFCLPSVMDSFGMGFVEAMGHGLPVVAVNWGPIADVVPDGTAGILVERQDDALVAAAIERLLAPELRRTMGAAGRQWVLEQFAQSVVAARLRDGLLTLREERHP